MLRRDLGHRAAGFAGPWLLPGPVRLAPDSATAAGQRLRDVVAGHCLAARPRALYLVTWRLSSRSRPIWPHGWRRSVTSLAPVPMTCNSRVYSEAHRQRRSPHEATSTSTSRSPLRQAQMHTPPGWEDWKTQRIVERTLHLAIKTCMDHADHIVADRRLRVPETGAESFRDSG